MKYRERNPSPLCKCGDPRRPGQRTCRDCHRFDMSMRRATDVVLKVMQREKAAK